MADAVVLKTSGDFKKLTKYLRMDNKIAKIQSILTKYGQEGVKKLAAATPELTGETKNSWTFNIKIDAGTQNATLSFWNTNIAYPVGTHIGKRGRPVAGKSAPIALILQYGHGTGTGGYVEGRDYINPVLQPLFDEIAEEVWKEVNRV